MPVSTPAADELTALRSGAALVDRSEQGRLALTGADAAAALNAVVTNEIETLTDGDGCWAACCTTKGKMLGLLRVVRSGEELLIDTDRCSLQAVFDAIRHGFVGYDAELHKRTLETKLFSLLGPSAREVSGAASLGAAEDNNIRSEIAGISVTLIATDRGVDVLCAAAAGDRVEAALLAAGATVAGEALAELARIESGRPRYGVDLDGSVIPQEGGLNERAVSFTKGCYIGQETIARLHHRGRVNRRLCRLTLPDEATVGSVLSTTERTVGTLTSAALSAEEGAIGLALVRREAAVGSLLTVGGGPLEARITASATGE